MLPTFIAQFHHEPRGQGKRMPLDFHIALSLRDAQRTHADLQLNDREHESICERCEQAQILRRISDFYADAQFSPNVLPLIRIEILSILAEKITGEQKAVFEKLLHLIDKAEKAGQGIFVFCD